MKRALVLLALVLLLPLAHAQDAATRTSDLYPTTDGKLANAPGSAPSACMTLSGPGATQAKKDFAGDLVAGDWTPTGQNVTLVVQLRGQNGNAQSGTGFTLSGALQLGNLTPIEAPAETFAPGTSPTSATLRFPLANATQATSGPVKLSLLLAPAGGALPVGAAQDLQVVCGTPNTRLASLTYATGAPPAGGGETAPPPGIGDVNLPLVAIVALIAGALTLVAGALVLAGKSISQRRIHLLLGATAGLLLAIALLDLIPEAFELNPLAPFTMAFGVLGLFAVKWAVGDHGHSHGGPSDHHGQDHGHDHGDGHAHAHDHSEISTHSGSLALIAFFALAFHRFVDGLVLPAAFTLNNATGFAAASAVLIHQFPDGIAAATVFLVAGWSRKRVLRGVAFMAIMTPVGAAAGLFLLGLPGIVGHLVALAAATFIFIALAELLPELSGREHRARVAVGFGIGYAVALAVILIPRFLGVEV